jgi:hypothetical protein
MDGHRKGAELAETERARLLALKSYDVLDTPAEEVFNELARLAASIVGVPVGLVSFVDGNRARRRAMSRFAPTQLETSKSSSFRTR